MCVYIYINTHTYLEYGVILNTHTYLEYGVILNIVFLYRTNTLWCHHKHGWLDKILWKQRS